MAEDRRFVFANFSRSTLAAAISASATEIRLAENQGDRFPSPDGTYDEIFSLILTSGTKYEIAYCTARSGDVLTVERAKEGTTAQTFPVGALAIHNATAGFFEQLGMGGGVDIVTIEVTVGDLSAFFGGNFYVGFYNSDPFFIGSVSPDPAAVAGTNIFTISSFTGGEFQIQTLGGTGLLEGIVTVEVDTAGGTQVFEIEDAQLLEGIPGNWVYLWAELGEVPWAVEDVGEIYEVRFIGE